MDGLTVEVEVKVEVEVELVTEVEEVATDVGIGVDISSLGHGYPVGQIGRIFGLIGLIPGKSGSGG